MDIEEFPMTLDDKVFAGGLIVERVCGPLRTWMR